MKWIRSWTEGISTSLIIAVKTITATKTRIAAKLEIDVEGANECKRKVVTVTAESDLFALSGQRENCRGYEVDLIDASNQYLQSRATVTTPKTNATSIAGTARSAHLNVRGSCVAASMVIRMFWPLQSRLGFDGL